MSIFLSGKFLRVLFPILGLLLLFFLEYLLEMDWRSMFVFNSMWVLTIVLGIVIRRFLQRKHKNHWAWVLIIPSILLPILLEGSYALGYAFPVKLIVFGFLMLYVFLLSETRRLIQYNRNYVLRLLAEANAQYAEYAYNALKSRSVVSFLQRALQDSKKLIAISEERAIVFIGKLTTILRYLLQSRNETLVPVFDEAQMVTELAALHKTQSGLDVEIVLDVPREMDGMQVPPFVLQMIVDNILINSSLIGRSKLEVYVENGIYLVVKFSGGNQKHANAPEFTQLIEDLQQRYEILDQRSEVITIFSSTQNYVKLPLIAD